MNIRSGFTLVEILVAMAIGLMVVGILTNVFMNLSAGSRTVLEMLELHARSDAMTRLLESDIKDLQQTAAIHLQADDTHSFTFMRAVTNQDESVTHRGNTLTGANPFVAVSSRKTGLIWVRWEWGDGVVSRGESPRSVAPRYGERYFRRINNTHNYLFRDDNGVTGAPYGMQGNGLLPQHQRYYVHFEGTGSKGDFNLVTGAFTQNPGEKLSVFKRISDTYEVSTGGGNWLWCSLFDTDKSVWRFNHNYNHLYTTLILGNSDKLSGENAYAVVNVDGITVNKDRLNLLGSDEDFDANGELLYESQLRPVFTSIEYFDIALQRRDGTQIGDGSQSIDINGIDPINGAGFDVRPTIVTVSCLIHNIKDEIDELDYDQDGNSEEPLASAVRDLVGAESYVTVNEQRRAFARHCRKNGFQSLSVTKSIKISL